MNDQGFVEHLTLMERQFANEASNVRAVQFPTDYHFTFNGEQKKVKFSAECLDPLMQEMEEVNMILRLLYASKINYLGGFNAVIPACQDDNDGQDILFTSSISNQWGLVTPYKISFPAWFSTEVASVPDELCAIQQLFRSQILECPSVLSAASRCDRRCRQSATASTANVCAT